MSGRRRHRRSPPGPAARLWRPDLLYPCFLLALVLGLYWNTLGHDFVHDDLTLIQQNRTVTEQRWGEILSPRVYRPVRTLTYALNYWAGGLDPTGYHLFNLLLHALNSLLVYWLFRAVTGRRTLALAGALLFAAHPVQTAATAYVSGRKDLLAAFFILGGCLSFLSYRDSGRRRYLVVCLACLVVGVLAKELVIVLPALLLLLDLCRTGRSRDPGGEPATVRIVRALLRSRIAYALGFLLAAVSFYYALYLSPASRMEGLWGGSLAAHAGTSFKLFSHYLALAVFPHPLIADYSGEVFPLSPGFADAATLLAVLLLAAFIASAVWLYPSRPLVSLGMGWFLTALAPVLQIVPFHELAADHFLYVPLIGVCLVGGLTVDYVSRERGYRELALGVLALVLVVFSVRTVGRNRDWADVETLWRATLEQAPGSYRAHSNLAVTYMGKQEPEAALKHTLRALELNPGRALEWSNLSALYVQLAERARAQRKYDLASSLLDKCREAAEEALERDDSNFMSLANMGNCFEKEAEVAVDTGETEEVVLLRQTALSYFQRSLKFRNREPSARMVWLSIGGIFLDQARVAHSQRVEAFNKGEFRRLQEFEKQANELYEQAIVHFKKFVEAYPGSRQGQLNLGLCYVHLKKFQEAVPHLERAVRLRAEPESVNLLAHCYDRTGDGDRAVRLYRQSIRLRAAAETHYNLGVLLRRRGELAEAEKNLKRALELSPSKDLARKIGIVRGLIQDHVRRSQDHGRHPLPQ
ncbi:MAG: tetratricopeptide repeat protein [Acidobacteriota bacterium]|nr:tetratricopeptide repeat protein [Acidobacteriota bacterium]